MGRVRTFFRIIVAAGIGKEIFRRACTAFSHMDVHGKNRPFTWIVQYMIGNENNPQQRPLGFPNGRFHGILKVHKREYLWIYFL